MGDNKGSRTHLIDEIANVSQTMLKWRHKANPVTLIWHSWHGMTVLRAGYYIVNSQEDVRKKAGPLNDMYAVVKYLF